MCVVWAARNPTRDPISNCPHARWAAPGCKRDACVWRREQSSCTPVLRGEEWATYVWLGADSRGSAGVHADTQTPPQVWCGQVGLEGQDSHTGSHNIHTHRTTLATPPRPPPNVQSPRTSQVAAQVPKVDSFAWRPATASYTHTPWRYTHKHRIYTALHLRSRPNSNPFYVHASPSTTAASAASPPSSPPSSSSGRSNVVVRLVLRRSFSSRSA